MPLLSNGRYRTKNGSTMEISSDHCGISTVSFDWVEEDACIDCKVCAYADEDGFLVWECEHCGGGRAELFVDSGRRRDGWEYGN